MSAETERFQAIRAQHRPQLLGSSYDNAAVQYCFRCSRVWPCDVATLLAALDAAEDRSTALQTALAQATNGYLHMVAAGTGYTVWHCRLCGDTTFDTQAPNHRAGCPVLVLADRYREE